VHLFCDESGGIAASNTHFTLAVVALDQDSAARILKTFRKAAKLKSAEIKGSSLSARHRRLFFEILAKERGGPGAAVVCARGDQIADWAIGAWQHQERTLYRHMLAEALGLIGLGPAVQGITADGGRYKHTELDRVAAELANDIERLAGRRVPFGYGDSSRLPGLQIADVLCNTAGKLLAQGTQQKEAARALAPLMEREILNVRAARLPGLSPGWLRSGEDGTL
jgi:hypothetical protein